MYPPPPYADAVCGTFVCGEAVCGQWWAYPSQSKLALGFTDLDDVIVITGDQVPQAKLKLGTYTPSLIIDETVQVIAPAGLRLGTTPPQIAVSSTVQVPQAKLRLGAIVPDSAGAEWLTDIECSDVYLVEDVEGSLVLVGTAPSEITLDPEECL